MRSLHVLVVAAGLATLAACGGSELEPGVHVELPREEIVRGRGFELTVERRWPEGAAPRVWDASSLDPLVVRELEVSRAAAGRLVVERRTYLAHALDAERMRLDPISLVWLAGGAEHERLSEPLDVPVRSGLGMDDDGALETPADPFTRIVLGPWMVVAGLGLLLAGHLAARAGRRAIDGEDVVVEETVEAVDADALLREELAALMLRIDAGTIEVRAGHDVLAATLRQWMERRLDAFTPGITPRELFGRIADADAVPESVRALLATEQPRFGAPEPERTELLEELRRVSHWSEGLA